MIRFVDDDANDSSDEETPEVVAERTMDIDGDVTSAQASADDSLISLAAVSTLMQAGLDRAIAGGGDIKRRASKMLVDFLNSMLVLLEFFLYVYWFYSLVYLF